jgi:hypothetical protein
LKIYKIIILYLSFWAMKYSIKMLDVSEIFRQLNVWKTLVRCTVIGTIKGAVKRAVEANFGAVKGRKRAVDLGLSSREGLAGPGNPG